MWPLSTDHLTTGIAVGSGLLAAIGALIKLRPRRFISWLAAATEREALRAMLANEQELRAYWQEQATDCLDVLRDRQP